ncbi:MAG: DMT family transporter [Planctomycetaceae bacterium]
MDMFWISMAAAAGCCIALQASANGSLRGNLDSPYFAAFFSICGTILTAVAFMLVVRPHPPSLADVRSTPWWNWIGGPLGALIVLSGAAVIPKVGAATFIAAVVGGQLALSLVLDHFGWMDLARQPLSAGRLLGATMVFVGVLLVKYL